MPCCGVVATWLLSIFLVTKSREAIKVVLACIPPSLYYPSRTLGKDELEFVPKSSKAKNPASNNAKAEVLGCFWKAWCHLMLLDVEFNHDFLHHLDATSPWGFDQAHGSGAACFRCCATALGIWQRGVNSKWNKSSFAALSNVKVGLVQRRIYLLAWCGLRLSEPSILGFILFQSNDIQRYSKYFIVIVISA